MKLHILQHVSYEGPGYIATWANFNGFEMSTTLVSDTVTFPEVASFDLLVILGGPMNVDDSDAYPWLEAEKHFIHQAIAAKKPVLGICLGSQLIAQVLGGRVMRNPVAEIGWFPIAPTDFLPVHPLFQDLDFKIPVFHWHGDTFELPDSAQNLFRSRGCQNQLFVFGDRVIGIQFHPEATRESVKRMVENGADELRESLFIQSEAEILKNHYDQPNAVLAVLLDRLGEFRKETI